MENKNIKRHESKRRRRRDINSIMMPNLPRHESKKRRRGDEKRIMMPNLPGEIVDDILFMLPAKSICRFKCVCKRWRKLFKNPDFVKSRLKHSIETEKLQCFSINGNSLYMHITRSLSMSVFENDHCASVWMGSPFESDKIKNIKLLGSCNGLILMKTFFLSNSEKSYDNHYWVWNPCTKERKEIVIPSVECEPVYCRKTDRSIVLGYNCDTDDHEIVVAACYASHIRLVGCRIQVYRVRSNSWKTFANIVPYRIVTSTYGNANVVVNGVVYWIAMQLRSEEKFIVSFDIHDGKWNQVAVTQQIHKFLNDTNSYSPTLGVLGECLCIVRPCGQGRKFDLNFEIWVKKYSWTKLFIVKPPVVPNCLEYVKLLWEFKNGEVLFVTNEFVYGILNDGMRWYSNIRNCRFVIYDPVSQECKATRIEDTALYSWNIEAYVESSLMLNSSDEEYAHREEQSVCLANTEI